MHKLLFDQNLSYLIIEHLEHLFPHSEHVKFLNLDKADDLEIWHYAKEHSFTIVSKDTDFNNLHAFYGYPPKVIWINTGNTRTAKVIALLKMKYEIIDTFLDNKQAGFLELH